MTATAAAFHFDSYGVGNYEGLKIAFNRSNHAGVRASQRELNQHSAEDAIVRNISDVADFVLYNTKYEALMLHDRTSYASYVLGFHMSHGTVVITLITQYQYPNATCHEDTLYWECKH